MTAIVRAISRITRTDVDSETPKAILIFWRYRPALVVARDPSVRLSFECRLFLESNLRQ